VRGRDAAIRFIFFEPKGFEADFAIFPFITVIFLKKERKRRRSKALAGDSDG
jgi:hypothetical protein